MRFAEFWDAYRAYSVAGSKERQAVEAGGARFELYFSMGTPRARFQPASSLDVAGDATGEALGRLAEQQNLRLDFRDDSYVVTDGEGVYLGRVRSAELLFSPDRLVEQPALLEGLVGLY